MKITITIEPTDDTEVRFFDACKGAATTLLTIARMALDDGDCAQFIGTRHVIREQNEGAAPVGDITITGAFLRSRD